MRHPHNLVSVIMHAMGMNGEDAASYAAELHEATARIFNENVRHHIPRWGHPVDGEIDRYVQGLRDWVAGSSRCKSGLGKDWGQLNGRAEAWWRYLPPTWGNC